jgi:hypothetical protein
MGLTGFRARLFFDQNISRLEGDGRMVVSKVVYFNEFGASVIAAITIHFCR